MTRSSNSPYTPTSVVTDVSQPSPSNDVQLTTSDNVPTPDSEDTQPNSTSPAITKASAIDTAQAPTENSTQQPPADDT